jgi:predicted nucleic acid-binding protein
MLFASAMSLAREVRVGFDDSLYLAAADRLDCQLVTADAKFVSAASQTRWESKVVRLDALADILGKSPRLR